VLQRRSPLAIRGDLSPALVAATAAVMARELGWSAERTGTEIADFVEDLATYHGVRLDMTEGVPR
jgi:glycerol-3-phosphate dehydrogenase